MWWTEETIAQTVTAAYINSHLRAHEQIILLKPLAFGGDLTDENYLDWILSRAKRFFLILVAVGLPDQIFGIVDDSFDDEDLPMAADRVEDLRLSFEPDPTLDRKFYKTQFRYLTRILENGEHIRYAEEETVPITPLGIKSVISFNKDGVDTVKLPNDPSKVFVRRRINLESPVTEESILQEIAALARFSHEHVTSVFASCLQGNNVTILSIPAPEWTLRGFLMDTPKSFELLPKSNRRRILLEWPHCLANALSWLHANGAHHGNVRPSTIIINQQYLICLGPLEGEGVLTSSTTSDDIESYQYAPPERWKRAVTVQSTGSGKVTLPSGGRSARKSPLDPLNPADPSTRKRSGSSNGMASMDGINSYTFLPASKSETYMRFRLSTAVNPGGAVVPPPPRRSRNVPEKYSSSSRSTTRPAISRGHLVRSPSVLSQTSSEDKRGLQRSQGIFAAAPEEKTAVVTVWRSNLMNSFAADVFSLGAVSMDVLTVLCKRTFSSFSRHRSAKNRNAGRGGGLADASFHANLGQVMIWAEQIQNEAAKKAKSDESGCMKSVGAVLQVVVQCLERSPEARPKSSVLEQRLGEHIRQFAHIDPLHCAAQILPDKTPTMRPHQRALEAPSPLLSPIQLLSDRSSSRSRQTAIEEEPPTRPSTVYSPSSTTETSRNAPQSPPYLPSLNFDTDGRSDTVVVARDGSRGPSVHRQARQPEETDRHRGGIHGSEDRHTYIPQVSTPKEERWDYLHSNESAVDPRLTLSTDGSEPSGVFNFMNYSTSPSDDGEEPTITTYHYPLPPRPPPNRKLPPPPKSSKPLPAAPRAPRNQRHRHKVKSPPPEPSMDDIAMLQKLSRTAIGGHPPRMSSLNNEQTEDEEEDEEEQHRDMARVDRRPLTPAALKLKGDRRERVYRA